MEKMNIQDRVRQKGTNIVVSFGFDKSEAIRIEEISNEVGFEGAIFVQKLNEEKTLEEIIKNKENFLLKEQYEEVPSKNLSMIGTKKIKRIVIFSGASNYEIHTFIGKLKSEWSKIPLFAIATDINKTWTYKELMKELNKEREQLSKK